MSKPICTKSAYAEKLKDPRWQRKRLEVLQRDEWTCLDCGATDKSLQVHHHHYVKGSPWDAPANLLSTLCGECHRSRQEFEDEARGLLGLILAHLSPADSLPCLIQGLRSVAQEAPHEAHVVAETELIDLWCKANPFPKLKTAEETAKSLAILVEADDRGIRVCENDSDLVLARLVEAHDLGLSKQKPAAKRRSKSKKS